MCGSNILLPSTEKQRKMAGSRLLHLQFAQQKCILYVYGGNVFLQYIFAGAYYITVDVIVVYT